MNIKRIVLSCLAAAGFICHVHGFEFGKADAVIYYAKQYSASASELAGYLNRIYGKNYSTRLFNGKTDAPGIYLGVIPSSLKLDVPAKRLYIVRYVNDGKLFLYGNDDKKLKLQGSRFAMYDMLQDVCGVRWLWPGETGTVVEKRAPDTLKDGISTYIPPLDQRLKKHRTGSIACGIGKTQELSATVVSSLAIQDNRYDAMIGSRGGYLFSISIL